MLLTLARRGRPAALLLALVVGLGAGSAVTPMAPVAAASDRIVEAATVAGSPFSPNGDGVRDRVYLDVVLARAATVSVSVLDFGGRTVRTIASGVERAAGAWRWTWNGRDDLRRLRPDGPYRFRLRVVADGTEQIMELGIAKAPRAPFPARPGAITVVLNAGHGGREPGAVYGSVEEEDMTLDTALRLRAMLEASGVRVVMIRTADRAANDPPADVTGDGTVDAADEQAARLDIANLAQGDLMLSLMYNAYGCHCVRGTESFTGERRTWTPEAVALGALIQRGHMRRLEAFRSDSWYPIDRGVRFYEYYAMKPYHRTRVPRPTLMPTVLVESLFMDHANELAVIKRPKARTAIAVGYFDGITGWLARRALGLRVQVSGPAAVMSGEPVTFPVHLTNTGNAASTGWTLEARAVPRVALYDGSGAEGVLLGSVAVPDGVAPGQSLELPVGAAAPSTFGEWLVKFDVRLGDGTTMSPHGVVFPQLPLTTSDAGTSGPDPSAAASGGPSEDPTAVPEAAPPSDPTASTEVARGSGSGRDVPHGSWLQPPPGWSATAWREIVAHVVHDHGPDQHLHHHP